MGISRYKYWPAFIALSFAVTISAQVVVGMWSNVKVGPTSKMFEAVRRIRDIQILSADDMQGRSADRSTMLKARAYVESRFSASKPQPSRQQFEVKQRATTEVLKGVNFVGQIKERKHADEYIIMTAHHQDGVEGGETYDGADDHASGTAPLFATASSFKKNPTDHSLILVAFDAEERGHLCARHFASNLPVKEDTVVLNVNMVSWSDKCELYAVGAVHYPQFINVLNAVHKKAKVKLIRGHDIQGTGQRRLDLSI